MKRVPPQLVVLFSTPLPPTAPPRWSEIPHLTIIRLLPHLSAELFSFSPAQQSSLLRTAFLFLLERYSSVGVRGHASRCKMPVLGFCQLFCWHSPQPYFLPKCSKGRATFLLYILIRLLCGRSTFSKLSRLRGGDKFGLLDRRHLRSRMWLREVQGLCNSSSSLRLRCVRTVMILKRFYLSISTLRTRHRRGTPVHCQSRSRNYTELFRAVNCTHKSGFFQKTNVLLDDTQSSALSTSTKSYVQSSLDKTSRSSS